MTSPDLVETESAAHTAYVATVRFARVRGITVPRAVAIAEDVYEWVATMPPYRPPEITLLPPPLDEHDVPANVLSWWRRLAVRLLTKRCLSWRIKFGRPSR